MTAETGLQVYLVGGAVRDELLGLTPRERDWVVIGATQQQMLDRGFKPVGKDFPVFLHPQTGEEYALARKERKSGHGYRGFVCEFDPGVSLEEDLLRRDLTVNAIARDPVGTLIDPYNGCADLERRQLRHVSDAFVEDPLRVLRTARFAARFHLLGFSIDTNTLALMHELADSGELDHLAPERIWQEIESALTTDAPDVFFTVLRECAALDTLMPELSALWTKEPSSDRAANAVTNLESLREAASQGCDATVRFGVLTQPLDADACASLCQRLRAPSRFQRFAEITTTFASLIRALEPISGERLISVLESLDAFRQPERFEQLMQALTFSDPWESEDEGQINTITQSLRLAFTATRHIRAADLHQPDLRGPAVGVALRALRCERASEAVAKTPR